MPIESSHVVVPTAAITQPRTIRAAEVIAICLGVIAAELTRGSRRRSTGSVPQVTALDLALERMRADGAQKPVLAAFARRFAQLQDPDAGPELATLLGQPLAQPVQLAMQAGVALRQAVVFATYLAADHRRLAAERRGS